jgi:ABC-type multidrug transport system fused ATPase/permease subunit
VQSSFALFARVFEYLDLRPQITDGPRAEELPAARVRGEVELDAVSFAYGPRGTLQNGDAPARHWALRDVTLEVKATSLCPPFTTTAWQPSRRALVSARKPSAPLGEARLASTGRRRT